MLQPTLLDIAKMNGSDALVGLIDEAMRPHPELTRGAARTIRGMNFKTLVRTTLPQVGFRAANEGSAEVKGEYENRLVETFIMNPRWKCDKAVADRHEDGAEAFIALEAGAVTGGALATLASQFYYGVSHDAKGFPGLKAAVDAALTVNASGTTASTASSLYAVKFGPMAVQWVYGNNGSLEMSDVDERDAEDADGNKYTAYFQELLAYPGLQVNSRYAVGRIKNLTADSGKGLTDDLIGSLLSKFPIGWRPDVIYCSRRSLEQLRASRTATNATGAPAPMPTEAFGVPIEPTEALVDTEAIE